MPQCHASLLPTPGDLPHALPDLQRLNHALCCSSPSLSCPSVSDMSLCAGCLPATGGGLRDQLDMILGKESNFSSVHGEDVIAQVGPRSRSLPTLPRTPAARCSPVRVCLLQPWSLVRSSQGHLRLRHAMLHVCARVCACECARFCPGALPW